MSLAVEVWIAGVVTVVPDTIAVSPSISAAYAINMVVNTSERRYLNGYFSPCFLGRAPQLSLGSLPY